MKIDDALTVKILALNTDDVLQVYSGRNGKCCCGCAGTHSYNPDYRELGGENRGYSLDDEDCNMKVVKRILNKVKKNVTHPSCDWQGDFVSVVLGDRPTEVIYSGRSGRYGRPRRVEHLGRLYVVYFKPSEADIRESRARRAAAKAEQKATAQSALQGAGI